MLLQQYGRRDLYTLAKLLIRKQPQLAAELLSTYQPAIAHDTNLQNIPAYFTEFCDLNNISSHELAFSRYNSEMVENKKLFICCLVEIYSPGSLKTDEDYRYGLVTALAATLNQTHQYISLLLKEVVVQYKVYDDFRERVDECSKKMKGGQSEKAA